MFFLFCCGDFWIASLIVLVYLVYFMIESSFLVRKDSSYDIFYSYLNIWSFYVLVDLRLHYLARLRAYYSDFNLFPLSETFEA